jgi:hypothetical protein
MRSVPRAGGSDLLRDARTDGQCGFCSAVEVVQKSASRTFPISTVDVYLSPSYSTIVITDHIRSRPDSKLLHALLAKSAAIQIQEYAFSRTDVLLRTLL